MALALALSACAPTKVDTKSQSLEAKLAQNPNDARLNLQLGESAEATGELLKAEQYYLRAEALGVPEGVVLPRLLRVLVTAQRYEEALDRCRRRLSQAPDDRATRYVEAALLVAAERPRDAERELTALMRSKPDDPRAYLELGRLYKDGYNDKARANEMFERYLALAPDGADAAAIRYEMEER
jgi:predicted Zn-dependent protease